RNCQRMSSIGAIQPSQWRSSGWGAYHTDTAPSRRFAAGNISINSPPGVRMSSMSWRAMVRHGRSKAMTIPSLKNWLCTFAWWTRGGCARPISTLARRIDVEMGDRHAFELERIVDIGRRPVQLDRMGGLDERQQHVEQGLRILRHGIEPKAVQIALDLL